MAGKKLNLDDFKKKVNPLSAFQQKQTNGGYNTVSPGSGSIGHIQWDEIDFRNLNEDEKPAFNRTEANRSIRTLFRK